ncbi:MAG: L-aspartate oxidase [Planctomycetales bacterium]
MRSLTLPIPRRYLVRFHPKRIPHAFTDVLIIGGGIAGLRAGLTAAPHAETLIVTKDRLNQSNSAYAQGGIAGVLDPLDAISNHIADTISAGKGLCDREIVEMVVREAPERIQELIRWGTKFDRNSEGEIELAQEGGHSHRRIVHALGDATGKEVIRAMIENIRAAPRAQIWESTFTIDLLTHEGECRGALVWNPHHGKTFIWAKQTILATGGCGRVYRETTNPPIATGDGHALAYRAGTTVRDMEFMQFHPTVLYIAGSSRHLISEAARGEGAYLRDCHGVRFMSDYAPKQLELAPRDEVSRAITQQMEKTKHPCVYLDLTHLPRELILQRFPHISRVCAEFGLDITKDPIPVRPGAHYMIGGVKIDEQGKTSLPHLWAAGEVTSSGLHGANRLASNSLLEGLVFGKRVGQGALEQALSQPDSFQIPRIEVDWPLTEKADDELNLLDVSNSLGAEMWRNVGIEREHAGLESAGRHIEFWDRYVSSREFQHPAGWELQNMLLVARLMIAAADARRESRGTHYRRDFPQTDPLEAVHIELSRGRE